MNARPLKIALIADRALPKVGGSEIVVDRLATALARLGQLPSVIAPRPGWLTQPDDSRFPYRIFRHPPYLSSTGMLAPYLRQMRALQREHAFDLLHCHQVLPQAHLAAVLSRESRLPMVITSHGRDMSASHSRYRDKKARARAIDAISRADACIAVSESIERDVRNFCPSVSRIIAIPNGVDYHQLQQPAERPADAPASLEPKRFLLFLGRLTERKGADDLLSAYRQIDSSLKMPLVIAGTGREETALRRRVEEASLDASVWFAGVVSGARKAWLLQQAFATIIPTRTWEACSLVALESFAAGTPVIGTAVDGLADLLVGQGTGLCCPPSRPDLLAEAVTSLLSSPGRAESLGCTARRFAARYDWLEIAKQHLALYRELSAMHARRNLEPGEPDPGNPEPGDLPMPRVTVGAG